MYRLFLAAVVTLAPVANPAFAQTGAPAAEPPALCTDRPTKSNYACAVPEGMVQVETDLFSWTRAHIGGTRTDVLLYSNPTLKLGIGPNTDVQANIVPLVEVRTRANGVTTTDRGVGDLVLRLKHRLTDPSAPVQVAVLPFVKAPTARRGIGNREWEGGLAVPVNVAVGGGATLTFGPELDLLADADGSGHHVQAVGTVNIAKLLSSRVTLIGELWTAQNFDPAGTVRQYSADVAATYLVRPNLQLDVGGNFGLNRATPDAQLYLGLSTRF
jgi:hypothetical protein